MIRVKNKFKELKQKKQKAFGVFLTAGYPSLEYSKDIFKGAKIYFKRDELNHTDALFVPVIPVTET